MFKLAIAMTKQAVTDRKGVTAMEYAIIAAAIAAVVIVSFQTLGGKVNTIVQDVITKLG